MEPSREGIVPIYQPTIIDSRLLLPRLATELSFAAYRAGQAWSQCRKDPVSVGIQLQAACRRKVLSLWQAPLKLLGCLVSTLIVFSIILLAMSHENDPSRDPDASGVVEKVVMVDLTLPPARQTGSGIGAGAKGRVGFGEDLGEGSKPEPARATGGGGSGKRQPLPTQRGKTFAPSEIPAVVSAVKLKNPALPQGGIDIDPALWKAQTLLNYGDPRSKSTLSSHGPGEGDNYGSGRGPGIGEGEGPGFGPGEKGNTGGDLRGFGSGRDGGSYGNNVNDLDRVFPANQVSVRLRILSKPEPQYTEEARRTGISGTVVLRAVFSSRGEVINIRAVQPLPCGLTERAIAAARQIRFLPALKGGRLVSVYMQLEYNFNLY